MKEALYYLKLKDNKVQCILCPHQCIINNNKTGICNSRCNIDGILYAAAYKKISSIALDPIEKKPLYHFYPGKKILSIGSIGCNLKCVFCQNFEISQTDDTTILRDITSEKLLEIAFQYKDNIGIAFTYNEPLINIEFLLETAQLFLKNGLKNVLISNGIVNTQPLMDIIPYINAANIDLKGIRPDFYKNSCFGGNPEFVLKNIELLFKSNIVVEVTNLIVTGLNDDENDIKNLVNSIAEISKTIPLHFSRYYPHYKYNEVATPEKKIKFAYEYAKKKLDFVYLGNM